MRLPHNYRWQALGLLFSLSGLTAHASMELMFKSMDADKNEQVTWEENWTVWKQTFGVQDKNKDARLDASEVSQQHFQFADTNKDGGISLEEEEAFRAMHFERLDMNQDKMLSWSEMTGKAETPAPTPAPSSTAQN